MVKGIETRERILSRAFRLASKEGLYGLTIGVLASELSMSKSGLFAHFGSKEDLQVAVLEEAARHFEKRVVLPAFKEKRGAPRVKRLFENWLAWGMGEDVPGGCPFVAAAAELDDKAGRPRDFLVELQQRFIDTLAKAAQLAVEEGHFRQDLNSRQFAFEMYAMALGFHHAHRLMRDKQAASKARTAFVRLLKDAQPN